MNIVFLNDDFPPYGHSSVSTVVAQLAEGYGTMGHTTHVITTHRTSVSPNVIRSEGMTSLPCSYRQSLRAYRSLSNERMTAMLDKELQTLQPEIVHAHNLHHYLTYDALRIARRHTPRVFITMHDCMSFSFGRLASSRYLDSGGTLTHVGLLDQIRQARLAWNPLRNAIIRRCLDKNARKVIAVSHALEQALLANGIGNTTVIHHGMDVNRWQMQPEETARFQRRLDLKERPTILFGGRISIDKGVKPIIAALDRMRRKIPRIRLLIAGEKKRWEPLFAGMNASADLRNHIVLLGWLAPRELRVAMSAVDVVTTPSLCLDTFNLMNLEAMAAGKPVVGTMFGGTPEIVVHGETGFVCDPRDTETYAAYLQDLLLHPDKAKRMGAAGRKRVEEQFSLAKQTRAYLHLFSESDATEYDTLLS